MMPAEGCSLGMLTKSVFLRSSHLLIRNIAPHLHNEVSVTCGLRTSRAPLLLGDRVHIIRELLLSSPALLLGAVQASLRGFSFLQRLLSFTDPLAAREHPVRTHTGVLAGAQSRRTDSMSADGDSLLLGHLHNGDVRRCVMSDLGALDELLGGGLLVAQLSSPCVQRGGLQGAAVREGQSPGLGEGAVVDGVKVDAGIFLGLAT
ncbi:hypothetical protein F7725_006671 [Dissostichus mawsoni]|uniref:Uncharacterized protein n=1 Tax=Dissostichus mawsoni TaxID=36200 RepID=A0A7J5XWC6_DISMA|nr:hypothetical protein F7725_006671 [Dissostichus mawsoni]